MDAKSILRLAIYFPAGVPGGSDNFPGRFPGASTRPNADEQFRPTITGNAIGSKRSNGIRVGTRRTS